MRRLIILLAASVTAWGASCPTGYGYYKTLTVQTGKVSGTQTSFPALVLNPASTSGKLATVANGGRVTSSSGYDIVPSTTAGSLLPFELVTGSYAATTGNLQMWVNVSSIVDGTVINICYGNAAVTTYQGNNATTWSGFTLVSHGDDNAATTAVADSTGTWPGTALANTSTKTTAGKIGNALTYSGSDEVSFGNVTPLNGATAFSVSMWSYVTTAGNYSTRWSKYDYGLFVGLKLGTMGSDSPANNTDFQVANRTGTNNTNDAWTSSHPETAAAWHLLTYVFDGSQGTPNNRVALYVDGALVGMYTCRGSFPTSTATTTQSFYIGGNLSGDAKLNGKIDDVQVIPVALSAAWVTTSFNNQNNPGNDGASGFWSVGTEQSLSSVSFTIAPTVIPNGHAGNITLTLTGSGTSWSGSTVMTASGVANVTCGAVTVTSTTAAHLTCTTGAGTGTLTLTESVTGIATATTTVSVPTLAISPTSYATGTTPTLTLTGMNTIWSQETAAGLFTVSGGTGASIGTPTITGNMAGTVALTVGTATGILTIRDTSTGKTTTFAAGGSGGNGCAVVTAQ